VAFDAGSLPRRIAGSDIVYGRRPVYEVLQAGRRSLHKLWVAQGTGGGVVEDVLRLARERGTPVEFVPRARLDRMAGPVHHQGVIAQVSAAALADLHDYLASRKAGAPHTLQLILALDEIQDPQNIGAILRSAAFFGVDAVLVPRWRSAPVGETAGRASSGAIEHVQLIRVGNLVQALDQLREAGFEIVGADAAGSPLAGLQPSNRSVIVMGNEGKGLRRLVREHCDKLVGIPRRGKLDSLNVGAATAIVLYEFCRGRGNALAS
jgi:23S rRNA (guanosine2251-2'-O)-methyltransferase